MFWWSLVIMGILYLVIKGKIRRWVKLNKEKIEEWKKIPEIWKAYLALEEAFKEAGLDKKWTLYEILIVITLAMKLLNAIKRYEEGGETYESI